MEGPEKKPALDPAAAYDTVINIVRLTDEENASIDSAKHAIETRIFPALRALDYAVRHSAVHDGVCVDGYDILNEVCCAGYSLELMRYIVEDCGANVHAMSHNAVQETALVAAMYQRNADRDGREYGAIIAYLVSHGASLSVVHPPDNWTALMQVCQSYMRPAIVERMIQHGADVHTKDLHGATAIEYAIRNRRNAPAMVDCLVRAGSHVNNKRVLSYIYDHLDAMSEVVIHAALWRGHCVAPTHWGLLRTNRPEVWRLYAHRMGSTVFAEGGDTLLHVAARYQATVLHVLMHRDIMLNPWIPIRDLDKLARDVAADKHTVVLLDAYATWTPVRAKTRWYGPLFEERALCFAMVCKRWRAEGVRTMPRDAIYKVLEWVARVGMII